MGQHLGTTSGWLVLLSVRDTGYGMDQETLAHILEPFFTTEEKGKRTGLGLSTVYGIVKQAGGYIMAYSEPGRGSTFKIIFPAPAEFPNRLGAPTGAPKFQEARETVLLVEDETALRELTHVLLEKAGYTLVEASNVEDALRLAESAGR